MNQENRHMFTNRMLLTIVLPCVLEQLLNSLMGTFDTMMVSSVGASAISAVSLVDSINVLVIQAFAALGAGGSIICAQFMGQKKSEEAKQAGKQLLLIAVVVSGLLTIFCLVFCHPMLRFIFGRVDHEVMRDSVIYFYITALSFPFISLFGAGSAILRAQENTREPMLISVVSNVMNIVGNAWLIFGLGWGIAGAALSTLISRVFCAVMILIGIRSERQAFVIRDFCRIRPKKKTILSILSLGIPSGIENGMFQLGKLAIQSTVSTLGTTAIAAQAMTGITENMSGIAGVGVGIALMTIVGECIGAGRKDEAVYYIKKLTVFSEILIVIGCWLVYVLIRPITVLSRMEAESAALCIYMMGWITVVKVFLWTPSFIPAYGMRGAGDVKFSMIVSCITMWVVRYAVSICCIRYLHTGPIGVWIGMFSDWFVRGVIFTLRFRSRKWMQARIV